MRVVLGRLADVVRDAPEVEYELVEIVGDAGKFRDEVARREGVRDGPALTHFARDVAELPHAPPYAQRDDDGQQSADDVNEGRHPNFGRLPEREANRRLEKLRRGMRRDQNPASPTALNGNDGCQNLFASVGLLVTKLHRSIPAAGLGEPRQDAAFCQAVELRTQLLGADARSRGDIVELLVGAGVAWAEHQP